VPQLSLAVWFGVAGTVLLLLGLCVGTAYAVLRASARSRVARWSVGRLLGLVSAVTVPWLFVWLAPIHFAVAIHGVGPLLGWLLLALLAFTLLVLLPLATLLCVVVWGLARARGGPLIPLSERDDG
jgi:Na+/H+-dicarboxylate symporter